MESFALVRNLAALWSESPDCHVLSTRMHVIMGLGVALALSLVLAWAAQRPRFAARVPKLAAAAWPYIPLSVLLMGLVAGASYLTHCFRADFWPSWTEEAVSTGATVLGVFWPWLPVALGIFVAGYVLARVSSRRCFSWMFLSAVASCLLAVALRPMPPCTGPGCHEATPDAPALPFVGEAFFSSLALDSSGWSASDRFYSPHARVSPCRLIPYRDFQACMALDGVPRASHEVLADRMSERIVTPLLDEHARLDELMILILGGGLFLLYFVLARINAHQDLALISVGRIENEKREPQPHLERLMMECISRSSPHAPPRFPGGTPIYWSRLAECLSEEKENWKARVVGYLMHVFYPSRELLTHGTLSVVPASGKTNRKQVKLSIELREVPSQRTQLARTFTGDSPEALTAQAAYVVAEHSLLEKRRLPDWALWRESDGCGLQHYWQGTDVLRAIDTASDKQRPQLFSKAANHFREAAKRSNGNALARLQLAEVLEAQQAYAEALMLYLDLVERYPDMVIATYRLAAVLGISAFWYKGFQEMTGQKWASLQASLERCKLIQSAHRPFPSRDASDFDIQIYFSHLCEHCLRRLVRISSVTALWWSLTDSGRRQRFFKTLLWPPRKRLALQRLVSMTRKGAELRRWRIEWCKALAERMTPPREAGARHQQDAEKAQTRAARKIDRCFKLLNQYAREAIRAAEKTRGAAWGQVHYNCACLYALNMNKPNDSVSVAPPSEAEKQTLEQKAVAHLHYALRDPSGPMASGSIWWVFEDVKLAQLRERQAYKDWKRVALAEKT